MRKKVKWHRLQEKRENRLNAQLKEGLTRAAEYKEEFLVCEPEHGSLLSKSDEDTEKRSTKYLLNHMEGSKQQEDLMVEASSETKRYYVFKSDNLCVNAGYIGLNDGELPREGKNIEI